MPENKSASSNKRKRYNSRRPQKKRTSENNSSNQTKNSNEYCSFTNSSILSDYYFGSNIFDYYSIDTLKAVVRDPIANNEELRKISQILYSINGSFTNTVDYMVSMPTLSRVIVPHGDSRIKKNRNKKLMNSALRTIKDKETIRDILFKGMIDGVCFDYFETTSRPISRQKTMTDFDVMSITEINEMGVNASIIHLPTDYTRIVGIKNSSYVIAFNLDYFDISSGESRDKKLRKFPQEIRDAYAKRHKNNAGNWVVLDNKKTIVHKIKSKKDEPWGRPIVLAAINDIMYGDYFTDTKRNVLDDVNNRILYQTFPEGATKGTSALTQKQQEAQHNAVKGAVMNKNNRSGLSFFSVAAGTKINAIDAANTNIFDEKYESDLNNKIALDLGLSAALLNGCGSGTHASQKLNLELVTSQIFQWIEQIESELNKCINANVIKDRHNYVEVKYLPITHVNKADMVDYAKELYLQGCGSISLWSAACGIEPEVFFAILDDENEQKIYEKYKPHATSFTMSGDKSADVGRPMDKSSQIEGTLESRESRVNNDV